jgi:CRISPR/Cas system-associated endoribonuclease Cas2
VLGTPLEQYLTKEEVLDKIENVKLTKKERNILNEAYECILLKYDIEEKKERNKKSAKYLKELIDNSKVKKINEMVNEYLEKCEEQRKILRKLKSIEEATILYNRK